MRRIALIVAALIGLSPMTASAGAEKSSEYVLGQLDAWLSSGLGAGQNLIAGMNAPAPDDGNWSVAQSTSIGIIFEVDLRVDDLESDADDAQALIEDGQRVLQDHVDAAERCDVAVVSGDDDDIRACSSAITVSTAMVAGVLNEVRGGGDFTATAPAERGSDQDTPASNEPTSTPDPSRTATTIPTSPPTMEPTEPATDTPLGETLSSEWFDVTVDSVLVTTIPTNAVLVTLVVVNTDSDPHEFGWTTGNFELEVGDGPAARFNLLQTGNVRSGADEWAGEFSTGNPYFVSLVFSFGAVDPFAEQQVPADMTLIWTPEEGPSGTFRLDLGDGTVLSS